MTVRHEPSKRARLWQKIKTRCKNTWRKVSCRKGSRIEEKYTPKVKGMWVHDSQTQLWRTIAPAFNKHGWAWIGPDEDKEKTPKPWETTVPETKVTPSPPSKRPPFHPGSICARWACELPTDDKTITPVIVNKES